MRSLFVVLLLLIVPIFGTRWGNRDRRDYPRPAKCTSDRDFPATVDYIVLGAGAAGSVVASRLSEKSSRKVLLIEAGGNEYNATDLVQLPINWPNTPRSPLDWAFIDNSETYANLAEGETHMAAGKGLGGTTLINTMMYVRGNREDYDRWNRTATGWSWNDVLPFFKKAETSYRYATNPTFHGNSGPIRTGPSGWQPVEDQLLVNAGVNSGLVTFTPDWNNGLSTNVVGFHEHTIDPLLGTRVTAYSAYLQNQRENRRNLYIADRCYVLKINFDRTKRAKSVTFVDTLTGESYTVSARLEIIVSLGALRTPQMLQLSGVGPAAELTAMDIPIVADRPGVGQNLHDHPTAVLTWLSPLPPAAGKSANAAAYALFAYNRTGVVASITARCNMFLKSSVVAANDNRPDGQVIWLTPGPFMLALTYLNKPKSRGTVKLASRDPTDRPLPTFNYFQHPDDIAAIVDIIKKTWQIANTAPLSVSTPVSAPASFSDADIASWVVGGSSDGVLGSGYHYAGSCKMGSTSDPLAVVDNRLRVIGVTGLRIADASIMPEVTSGNTQAPTYMIGERAARFIAEDNGDL